MQWMLNVLLAAALAIGSLAGARDANAVRHALESRYRNARNLKAAFFESYTDGKGGTSAESGTVYFSRPGRMRWEYESPERKLFLVDGTNVWFYVPSDHTASRAKAKDSADWRTPIALLAGKADMSQLCRSLEIVSQGDRAQQAAPLRTETRASAHSPDSPDTSLDTVLRCVPRGKSDDPETPREILFEVNPQAYLVRVVIREPGDLEMEFRFGNWEENIPIPEAKFHFQAPPGVAVVDEQTLAGELR
jgi:outer membrane lipoprotein carrier protein